MANFDELAWRQINLNIDFNDDLAPRNYNNHFDAFELSDNRFVKLFRLNKALVKSLIDSLYPFMKQPNRKSALDVNTKVCASY